MTLRLQADADLNQIIVHAVVRRQPTTDFRTAAAAGLTGLNDPEVLALAAGEGRVLGSSNPDIELSLQNKRGLI
jgi:hypothetical protein